MAREQSSYRDPDGFVFYEKGRAYRRVLKADAVILNPDYRAFYDEAIKQNLLLPFTPVEQNDPLYQAYPGEGAILDIPVLPFIAYPYEWGFEQLKQAALTTLDIGLLALRHGLSLKDATAFNVQQKDGRMIFIDHTSFEMSDNKLPWRPYSQFCRHFLAPLLILCARGKNANKLFRIMLDGIELEEACDALPFWYRFKPAILVHIYLHRAFNNRFKNSNKTEIKRQRTGNQQAYLEHLKRVIEGIKPPRYDTEWHDYYNNTNYQTDDFLDKERLLDEATRDKNYQCIWDLGGNNGHFSRIVARHAAQVISMDIDHGAIDLNFLTNAKAGQAHIYPIVQDWTNPSPALGLANAERKTLAERSKPDLIIALAVIHHLAITYNVPFAIFARQLAGYGCTIIVEYVGREDSQFKRLMINKDDPYAHYNEDEFEKSFGDYFDLIKKDKIAGTHRLLYQFKPKTR